MKNKDILHSAALAAASVGCTSDIAEPAGPAVGTYHAVLRGAKDGCMAAYVKLLAKIAWRERIVEALLAGPALLRKASAHVIGFLLAQVTTFREQAEALTEVKWEGSFPNLVVTLGKNYLLDNGMAGSGYTALFYMGLISSVSYSSIVAGDTQASHAGWLEAGNANAPTYSGTRKTTAWSAASGGSKALSAGLVFTFTGSGTVKGCFLGTSSAVDATTGTLFSAGLFSGGDQPVVSTNTLTVSYSLSI